MKYQKKPVIIDAFQFSGDPIDVMMWVETFEGETPTFEYNLDYINIHTLEGVMRADKNDFIIRGVQGEFYPCKPDIFEATYETPTQRTAKERMK